MGPPDRRTTMLPQPLQGIRWILLLFSFSYFTSDARGKFTSPCVFVSMYAAYAQLPVLSFSRTLSHDSTNTSIEAQRRERERTKRETFIYIYIQSMFTKKKRLDFFSLACFMAFNRTKKKDAFSSGLFQG